ncbi:MAG: nitroreductase family protein, partial [Methanomicrobiales archaeon]|nr:nitroreductase family protein [Methanomicrobiales archaeon]
MNLGTTIIKGRRSVRSFRETEIPDDAIRDAMECARQAPTAGNSQPWIIGVVKERETLGKIAGLTDHGKFIGEARACFAVFGEKKAKYYL